MRIVAVALSIIGVIAIVFGAMWLTVVFPGMEKLPADFKREDTLSGTYKVLDAKTMQLTDIPVTVKQTRATERNEGDKAFIVEKVETALPNGQPVPQFPTTELALVVDRVSRLYLEGGQQPRTGGMGLPMKVNKDTEYPIWVGTAGRALPTTFSGTDAVDGLQVYRYVIDAKDMQLTPDSQSGLPRVADAHIEIMVEPRSGATVDTASQTSISLIHPQAGKTPMFISLLEYTDENVAMSTSDAKSARSTLNLAGTTLPWLLMALGIFFVVDGTVLYGLFCWKRMKAKKAKA
jgi:hypothetical protein